MKYKEMNKDLIKNSINLLLKGIGKEKLNNDVINNTSTRVVNSWLELLSGYNINDKDLYKTFDVINKNLIIAKDINFISICEHHLLPFNGKISIGYIPNNKVLGLSKFSRIVECFARRLQLQERLVLNIANSIKLNLDVEDIFIVCECMHSCISCRGVNQKNSSVLSFYKSGKFNDYKESELLNLLK